MSGGDWIEVNRNWKNILRIYSKKKTKRKKKFLVHLKVFGSRFYIRFVGEISRSSFLYFFEILYI